MKEEVDLSFAAMTVLMALRDWRIEARSEEVRLHPATVGACVE
jgi:hypothetical protein